MVGKIKKEFGVFPEDIVVGSTIVSFDAEGFSTTEDPEVIEILQQVPGYTVVEASEDEPKTPNPDKDDEEASEDEEPKTPDAPAPKAPAKKAPRMTKK